MPGRGATGPVPPGPHRATGCAGLPLCLVPLAVGIFAVALAWALQLGGHTVGWLLVPLIWLPVAVLYRRWMTEPSGSALQDAAESPSEASGEDAADPIRY